MRQFAINPTGKENPIPIQWWSVDVEKKDWNTTTMKDKNAIVSKEQIQNQGINTGW